MGCPRLIGKFVDANAEVIVHAAERRIQERVKFPENYSVEFVGQFQNLQEARTRLASVVLSALVLIFVLS